MTSGSRASGPVTRIAAIDAGSNAIRFVVADVVGAARGVEAPGVGSVAAAGRGRGVPAERRPAAGRAGSPPAFRVVRKVREPIRLGREAFTVGHLNEDAMDAAARAFRGFRREIDALGVERFRAVATSATREARNRDAFLARIRDEADIDLEPISGAEEARLVHLAVRSRVDLSGARWVLADLGGGSVEVSVADHAGIHWSRSYEIGTVRLLETLEAARGCHDSLRAWVARELETLVIPGADVLAGGRDADGGRDAGVGASAFGAGAAAGGRSSPAAAPAAFAATGGNIEALARMALSQLDPLRIALLPVHRLDAVIHLLAGMTVRERMDELRLRPDRADVVLPAALVYRHVAALAGADHIVVPSVGVKEGVLLDVAAGARVRGSA